MDIYYTVVLLWLDSAIYVELELFIKPSKSDF